MNDKRVHTAHLTNEQLLEQLAAARSRLYNKLSDAEPKIKSSKISDYNKRYLADYFSNIEGVLKMYSALLFHSLRNSSIPLENFVLVDYGGGSGLLSLLALEVGVGTVVYNDIYDVSCTDVGYLSEILGLPLAHIVNGDVDDLISYLQKNSLSVNAITSFNVLEHIYDVESHFKKLHSLSPRGLRIVHASGANIENPHYVRTVSKEQIEFEYRNREKVPGHKERDSLRSYLEIRREMIAAYAPELTVEQVEELARATRGQMQQDIEKSVDEFRRQGTISYRIDHPTNTCDPYTGNWSEHLIDFGWLEEMLRREGFSVEILPGHYYTYSSLPKRLIKGTLNIVLRVLGRQGMFIAPYYIVYANSIG